MRRPARVLGDLRIGTVVKDLPYIMRLQPPQQQSIRFQKRQITKHVLLPIERFPILEELAVRATRRERSQPDNLLSSLRDTAQRL
jgi:hypothetical protein